MKKEDRDLVTLYVLQYLNTETDENHHASLVMIQDYLEGMGISVERRVLYRIFNALEDAEYPLVRSRNNKQFTYYLEHDFSSGEAFVLLDAVSSNLSLSSQTKRQLKYKLEKQLSLSEQNVLPQQKIEKQKMNNEEVIETISVLLQAIKKNFLVSFMYFDYDMKFNRKYRHNNEPYTLLPLHILSDNGRYYVICWSFNHQTALNFRIDKIENIQMTEQSNETVRLDLDAYLKNTFHAYTGEPDTVTAIFPNSMASQVMDQFSNQMILRSQDTESFTVSIRTAITPTLIAWFMQFQDQVTILQPRSMIDEMKRIANHILETYK